jgi:hypothetical protein
MTASRWFALLLAFVAAVVLAIGVLWMIFDARFRSRLEANEATVREQQRQIATLGERLDQYKDRLAGASPDEARDKIAALQAELDAARQNDKEPATQRHDPNALYQSEQIVAVVRGAETDQGNSNVTFSAITAQAELTLPGVFEFKRWKLRCEDSGLRSTTTLGGSREFNYYRIECKIL